LFNPGKDKKARTSEIKSHWMTPALFTIFVGGVASGAIVFFLQKKGLALGLLSGSLLSILNFRVLHSLSEKILKAGYQGRKIFWFWTLLRWVIAALLCWGLVLISPSCLLGALAGYVGALLVLAWAGWRAAASSGETS
jgi:hypothetical protein